MQITIRSITVIIYMITAIISVSAQDNTPHYNKALADSLGADEYGIRSYV